MRKTILILTCLAFTAIALSANFSLHSGAYALAAGRANSVVSLDISFCYNYLADYGNWVSMDPYGYVWCPRHMGYRWRPYSEGRWVWTDYGWTWIPDEDWGWIPFHYGRWSWDDDLGWFWVPGTIWGPAWVTWRYSNQYCGWAPLPPGVGFQAGVDLRSLQIDIPGRFWIFVQPSHFLDNDIRSHILPFERNTVIIDNTSVSNNIYVRESRVINEGIGLDNIERLTRKDVPRYSLHDAEHPGLSRISGHEIQIYRPAFRENSSAQPSVVLNRNGSRGYLPAGNIYEPRQQEKADRGKTEIARRQAEEKKILDETQLQEQKEMQRKQSEEIKGAQNSNRRAEIKRDYQAKMSELQKAHQDERKQLLERQQRDLEQARKANPPQKGNPHEQAGKGKEEERESSARNAGHR